MRTLLCIGAHVGDMELTCGGLIATEALKGNRAVLVALTAGEKGNPPGRSVEEYREQKVEEARAFASAFGGTSIVMNSEDGCLEETDDVIWPLVDIIRRYRPDVIITHWKKSVHKDHAAASLIAEHARYYAGNSGFKRDLPAHPCPKIFYTENLEDLEDFKPYLYLDTTSGHDAWLREVAKMEFVTKSTDHRYLDYYDALATLRGCDSGFGKAEAFMVRDIFNNRKMDSIFSF